MTKQDKPPPHPTHHLLSKLPRAQHPTEQETNPPTPSQIRIYSHARHQPIHTLTKTSIHLTINCAILQPPPLSICHNHSGLEAMVSDTFFSYPANEARYKTAIKDIQTLLLKKNNNNNNNNKDRCKKPLIIGVSVFCSFGCHRSVAMAERLRKGCQRLFEEKVGGEELTELTVATTRVKHFNVENALRIMREKKKKPEERTMEKEETRRRERGEKGSPPPVQLQQLQQQREMGTPWGIMGQGVARGTMRLDEGALRLGMYVPAKREAGQQQRMARAKARERVKKEEPPSPPSQQQQQQKKKGMMMNQQFPRPMMRPGEVSRLQETYASAPAEGILRSVDHHSRYVSDGLGVWQGDLSHF
ncbi:hypothetical protein MMC14_007381 [Varicellaria rhodocarpa]|nr:hypothetical protein [Varicellaria rhodocarpa]